MTRLGRHADLVEAAAAIGRVEIDDVAQQHLSFVEGVAPTDDRAHRQRAFTDAADHHLAAGLDALGDRDLAFARQQLDRTHLAQIHAHRIIGAADIVVVEIAADLASASSASAAAGSSLSSLSINVDPEFGEHRHRVFDLLRGHLIGGSAAFSSS